ncbi:secreted RxLR effector protein 161-like [Amaranthus tricolor]|uniref:secreted RxLR effector protein 161-like n=1 Tax=Amaranthus tricolor TaxID=29722 RepID=UPI0025841E14|nr:secreted RxLR effector protein 161-like [Amaranthus tricolor]
MDKAHPFSNDKDEGILGPEVSYLSAIGALMYLANNTRTDIGFTVSLLARYCNSPTKRHWNAGYLLDPHNAKSQNGYVFTYGGTAISWRSTKQTLTATSSKHAELIALYETSREYVWLTSVIGHIQE